MEETKPKSQNAQREEKILEFWKENDIFQKSLAKESTKGDFIFFDGPPTANGMPGLHHVEPQSFKDAIPRYKTMQGYRVPRRAGWDTHGLPVELQVEKELGLKSKKEIESYGVAAFNQKCKESVWKYKAEWMKMRKRMGFWTDMDNAYITYENKYIEALWGVVGKANEKGSLYKDFKVVPWCTRCGTGLSSHELSQPGAYKDVKDLSVYVKFKVKGEENTYILAWTTTPWTLPGNVGLAVGEDIDYVKIKIENEINILAESRISILDKEYEVIEKIKGKDLVGLDYEPLYPYLSELISEDQKSKLENAYKVYPADFVTTTDGMGIVHTAVMYGADDFDLGTKYDLPKFHLVNEEGKFIEGAGFLAGRYVKEADEKGKPTLAVDIVNDLTERGLLLKKENHMHSYPHCWRCDTPLIYYARTSWYFRMSALREQLLTANEKINWEPEHIKEGRFGEWLDGIKDWAISRDRYWGTPLPIWQKKDGTYEVVSSLSDLKEKTKKSGNKYFVVRHGEAQHNVENRVSYSSQATDLLTEKGKMQVKEVSEKLNDKKITKIISSPFERTKETAEIIAEALGLSKEIISFDERLKELNPGIFDDKTWHERNEWAATQPSYYQATPEGGESHQDAKNRFGDFMYEIENNYQNETILIVTHGIGLEVLPAIAIAADEQQSYEIYKNNPHDPCSMFGLDFTPLPHNSNYELDFHKPYIDEVTLVDENGEVMTRTKEVMDVWFDSGAMPYAQGHMLGEPVDFTPAPADYISEAIDQTRGWFYTLHAVANLTSDEPKIAYKNVICLGHILDANGQKMSKSKGNVVSPWDMFDKYGADAVRLWMYSVNQPGDSKNFDEKTLAELNSKIFTLLYNVLAFYELYRDKELELSADKIQNTNILDVWILARLNELVLDMTSKLDEFSLLEPVRAIRAFIDDLSTWYLRRSRDRLKEGEMEAKQTLYIVLKKLSILMAPFAPFTAEDIWQKLKTEEDSESVHLSDWPKAGEVDNDILNAMQIIREFVNQGHMLRQKLNLPVKQPLATFFVPTEMPEAHKEILKDELNVKNVKKGDNDTSYFDQEITPELKQEGNYRELLRAVQDLRKTEGLNPSDVVSLVISVDENGKNIVETFKNDFMKTAGLKEVKMEETEGLEVKVGDLLFKIKILK